MISSSFEGMPLSISAVSLEANVEPQSTSSTGWPKHFEHCDSQLPRVCSSVMLVSPLFLSFQRFRLPRGGEAVRLRGAFLSRVWLCPWRGARGLIVQMFYACRNKCADHASVHPSFKLSILGVHANVSDTVAEGFCGAGRKDEFYFKKKRFLINGVSFE